MNTQKLRDFAEWLKEVPEDDFNFGSSKLCAIAKLTKYDEEVTLLSDDWTFNWRGEDYEYEKLASVYFGLNSSVTGLRLFTPKCQQNLDERLPNCDWKAPPIEVAEMLLMYCDWNETK
jgi:hypothetical protein